MWNEDGETGSEDFVRDLVKLALIVLCIAVAGYTAASHITAQPTKLQHRIEAR